MEGMETRALGDLVKIGDEAVAAKQYVILWDKSGNVSTFLSYKGNLLDFDQEVEQVEKGTMSKETCIEKMRSKMTHSMKHGSVFCLNLGKKKNIDFTGDYNSGDSWEASIAFNYEEFRKEENSAKFIKNEESTDNWG